MNWLIFAILAATSFGFYNFFTKLASDKFSPTVALMFIAGTSFVIASIASLVLKFTGQPLTFSKNYLWFPVLAGLFTGLAEVSYLFMFSKNAPITIGTPLVVGGTTLVAILLGLIILKEPLSAMKVAGILFTIVGLILLARS